MSLKDQVRRLAAVLKGEKCSVCGEKARYMYGIMNNPRENKLIGYDFRCELHPSNVDVSAKTREGAS